MGRSYFQRLAMTEHYTNMLPTPTRNSTSRQTGLKGISPSRHSSPLAASAADRGQVVHRPDPRARADAQALAGALPRDEPCRSTEGGRRRARPRLDRRGRRARAEGARAAVPRLPRALPRTPPQPLEAVIADIYIRGRLMPRFGNMRLDRIDHARVSAWFDAASAERPGAANRAFEILRAMLRTARQWGELAPDAPDPPLIRLDFLCKQKASGFNPTPAHAGPYLSSFTTNAQRRFPRTPARASDLSGGSRNGDGRMSGPRRWPATIVRRRQAGDRLTHPFLRLPQLIELLRVQPEFAGCPEEATRVWRPLSISMMRLPDYKINRIDELLPWNCSTAADPGPLTSALRIRRP